MNVEPKPQNEPEDEVPGDESFATLAEVREAIEGLSDADVEKLMIAAKYFWKHRVDGVRDGWEQPDELLNEALMRTLEMKRKWRSSVVTIVKHLDRTMESISSHIAAKRSKDNLRLVKDPVEDLGLVEQGTVGIESSRVAEIAEARDEVRLIEGLFDGDDQALELLYHRRDGYSASETQAELGITKKQYEAGWKRIRRKLTKYTQDNEEA